MAFCPVRKHIELAGKENGRAEQSYNTALLEAKVTSVKRRKLAEYT